MISIERVASHNEHFIQLVKKLDDYLRVVDGEDHDYYHQYNSVDAIPHCIVLFENNTPIGCGGIKKFDRHSFEVKRMFVDSHSRGKGYATAILKALEAWAKELGAHHCVLETGKRMPDAIGLYQRAGYISTPNYGQYIDMNNSICFKKEL